MTRVLLAAALALFGSAAFAADSKPFTPRDLVMLERVSDPRVSPDGRWVAYTLRQTDCEANKGVQAVVARRGQRHDAARARSPAAAATAATPAGRRTAARCTSCRRARARRRSGACRWPAARRSRSPTCRSTSAPSASSPDGRRLALSLEVFPDCDDLACTQASASTSAPPARPAARCYDRLFIRHWDSWKTGTRAQLFIAALGDDGARDGERGAGQPRHRRRRAEQAVRRRHRVRLLARRQDRSCSPRASPAPPRPGAPTSTCGKRRPTASREPQNLTAANPATDIGPVFSPDGKLAGLARDEACRFRGRPLRASCCATSPAGTDARSRAGLGPLGRWPGLQRRRHALLHAAPTTSASTALFAIDLASGKAARAHRRRARSAASRRAGDALVVRARHADLAGRPVPCRRRRRRRAALTHAQRERLGGIAASASSSSSASRRWNDETVHGHVMKPWNFARAASTRSPSSSTAGRRAAWATTGTTAGTRQRMLGHGLRRGVHRLPRLRPATARPSPTRSRGDWGGKPLEDLQQGLAPRAGDSTTSSTARRAARSARSYGGYMVNWIAGNWAEPFKALVNHDGIFDKRSAWTTPPRSCGSPSGSTAARPTSSRRTTRSTTRSTTSRKWKTPMLVIHGEKDYRVPAEQGIATFTALQRRGIPSQLLLFPDENHWVLKPQNSVQWHETVAGLAEAAGWVDRHHDCLVKEPDSPMTALSCSMSPASSAAARHARCSPPAPPVPLRDPARRRCAANAVAAARQHQCGRTCCATSQHPGLRRVRRPLARDARRGQDRRLPGRPVQAPRASRPATPTAPTCRMRAGRHQRHADDDARRSASRDADDASEGLRRRHLALRAEGRRSRTPSWCSSATAWRRPSTAGTTTRASTCKRQDHRHADQRPGRARPEGPRAARRRPCSRAAR